MGRVILVSSPKGGTGKSAISRHLLVCAQTAGLDAVGVDFDPQRSFSKWASAREAQRRVRFPDQIETKVYEATFKDWRSGFVQASGASLGIVDTPPNVESAVSEMGQMSKALILCWCLAVAPPTILIASSRGF